MPLFVFSPPALPRLAVQGKTGVFPVNRIFCVARNYAAHAIEMGHDPDREPPFFFQKSAENLLAPGEHFSYPGDSAEVHHEIELVVALSAGGKDMSLDAAARSVFGYAVGLDLTKRDLQTEAKKLGRPWTSAKAFDQSAPCSPIVPTAAVSADLPANAPIWLDVNGERKQDGNLNQMIWTIPEVIRHLSAIVTLLPGDLIFTGTPSGVGPIAKGDELAGGIDGIGTLNLRVT